MRGVAGQAVPGMVMLNAVTARRVCGFAGAVFRVAGSVA